MKIIAIMHGVYPKQEMALSNTIEEAIKKAKDKLLSERDQYHHIIICEIGSGDIDYLNEICEVTREDVQNDIILTVTYEDTQRLDCGVDKLCHDILKRDL